VTQVVPQLRGLCPQMRVHVLGPLRAAVPGVEVHAPPADAIDAFPAGAFAAVPLHVGSGLRMRILEAWARGLPVVASPAAAAGLGARDGEQLLLAEDAGRFAAALARLSREPALVQHLVAGGRAHLERHHAPSVQCDALLAHYQQLAASRERS
jgi:glycosyltransferase involved in cell wall biosynthesis